eukprot:836753-Prymnesium_polylepis.2
MLDDDEPDLGDRVRAMQLGINAHLGPRYIGFDSVHCALSAVLMYHTLELWVVMDFMLPKGRARQVLVILQAADISFARIKKKHGVSVVSTTVWCETSAELAKLAHAQEPLVSAYELEQLIDGVWAAPINLPARELALEIIILFSCPSQLSVPMDGAYGLKKPLTHRGALELLSFAGTDLCYALELISGFQSQEGGGDVSIFLDQFLKPDWVVLALDSRWKPYTSEEELITLHSVEHSDAFNALYREGFSEGEAHAALDVAGGRLDYALKMLHERLPCPTLRDFGRCPDHEGDNGADRYSNHVI